MSGVVKLFCVASRIIYSEWNLSGKRRIALETLITTLVVIILLEHIGFCYLEMFLWTKDIGRKVFGNSREDAERTRILAANQGLYNGFLAAGLIWALFYPSGEISRHIMLFFLSCILVAGIYGGITAKRTILYIQAMPALIAIVLLLLT